MSRKELAPGSSGTASRVVEESDLASSLSPDHADSFPRVFATARMVARHARPLQEQTQAPRTVNPAHGEEAGPVQRLPGALQLAALAQHPAVIFD